MFYLVIRQHLLLPPIPDVLVRNGYVKVFWRTDDYILMEFL